MPSWRGLCRLWLRYELGTSSAAQGPNGRLRCGLEARPKALIPRLSPPIGEGVRATELLQHSISLHALRYSYVGREGEDEGKRWSVEAPQPAWALGSAMHDRYTKAG